MINEREVEEEEALSLTLRRATVETNACWSLDGRRDVRESARACECGCEVKVI